ncbi:hypothetical protein [Erysipelothrix anatis]|nr:hypothetical protein [Erysipelothrix anatis]
MKQTTKEIIIEQIEYLYHAEGIEDVEEIIEYLKTHEYVGSDEE